MLSKAEKELIAAIWARLTPVADDIGSEALLRMFTTVPGTKTYFSHLNISPRSPHMLSHGKKIVLDGTSADPACLPNDNPQIIGEPSKETSCKVRKSPVDVSQSKGIPEGLIMAIVHRAS
uniref:Globin domain-containing protein n=1 Tax=Mola mola TaxID=94237 RepID=A0A3Q3W5L0_MOLML